MTLQEAQEIAAKLPAYFDTTKDNVTTVTLRNDEGKVLREEKFDTYYYADFADIVQEVMEWEECK